MLDKLPWNSMPTTRTRRQQQLQASEEAPIVKTRNTTCEHQAGTETQDVEHQETGTKRKLSAAPDVEGESHSTADADDTASVPTSKRQQLSFHDETKVSTESQVPAPTELSHGEEDSEKQVGGAVDTNSRVSNEHHPNTDHDSPLDTITRSRIDNLPNLSSLSDQVLAALASLTYIEALQLQRDQSSPGAKQFKHVRSQFDPVRQLYSTSLPFLSAEALGLTETAQTEILRKTNQATYLSSVFTGEIGLRDMDQNFLNIFIPADGQLSEALGSIYIEIKTQAFITAWRTGAPLQPVVDELFPSQMQEKIAEIRGGPKSPTSSEQSFLARLAARRDVFLNHISNATVDQLQTRFTYLDFGREVSAYLAQTYGPLAVKADLRPGGTTSLGSGGPSSGPDGSAHTKSTDNGDFVVQAAQRAAEIAMEGYYADLAARQQMQVKQYVPLPANDLDHKSTPPTSNGASTNAKAEPTSAEGDKAPHSVHN